MKGIVHTLKLLGIRTRKESPQDEEAKNAQLLIRAGYVNKHMAGVYEFLPFGVRSLTKIMTVIREEMNALGAHEVLMPSLQNPDLWKKTRRWDIADVWFKSEIAAGAEVGFGWTHEEDITAMMSHHLSSHKDLPVFFYQMQTKFRNEKRARSGILRTREFIMKDMYSFCKDEEEHKRFYRACGDAYKKIFQRVGIGACTHKTFASGGDFSEFSYEFQTVCDAGEDIIYIHTRDGIAINKEVYIDEVLKKLKYTKNDFTEHRAVEVGNIFSLGTKYSQAFNLLYNDESGIMRPVIMGSYGIGPARLLGVIVELFGNKNSIILPRSVSPYHIHLIPIEEESDVVKKITRAFCDRCIDLGVDVLVDDRYLSAGEKFADADLIGIPDRVIISERSGASGGVEYTDRKTGITQCVPPIDAVDVYKKQAAV